MNPSDTRPGPPPTAAFSAATTSTHSASVGASGFSQSTGFPASMQARTSAAWVESCEAMTTASTPASAITASGSVAARAPTSSAAAPARDASRSATTATSAPLTKRCRVRAWSAPMMPAPMMPIRCVMRILL